MSRQSKVAPVFKVMERPFPPFKEWVQQQSPGTQADGFEAMADLAYRSQAQPWRVTPSFPSEGFECYWLTGNFGPHNAEKEIGTISGPQSGVQAANAAFIVRAVNSHEVLVKALEKIAALDPPRTDLIGAVKLARHIAKCALASAREAQP